MTTTVTITNNGPQAVGYAVVDPFAKTPTDPTYTTLDVNASVTQTLWLHQQVVLAELQAVDPKQ